MTRIMLSEDLGDPRVFEDEAIREQAAALQIHVSNLRRKIENTREISKPTMQRIYHLSNEMDYATDEARDKWQIR